ncbi:MAG: hypothetical protein RMI94_06900 [Bryobacterales bacterium]|nr:hypothetical protein [Bryobacterales bacterium]
MLFPLLLLAAVELRPQPLEPVRWSLTFEPASVRPGSRVLGRLTAHMEPGWRVYSMTTPRPPIATTVEVTPHPAIASVRIYQPEPARKLDPNFGNPNPTR